MPHAAAITGYIRFMQWFRKNHPSLYGQYWQNIVVPVNGMEVSIDASGLEEATFVRLMQLQFDYYYPTSAGDNILRKYIE